MKKMVRFLGVMVLIAVLSTMVACNNESRLIGTWEKESGYFELDGSWDYIKIREDESGTIKFGENGYYVHTDEDGEMYSDSYVVVDDTHLMMVDDGVNNTLYYSVAGGKLTLTNEYGTCIFRRQ